MNSPSQSHERKPWPGARAAHTASKALSRLALPTIYYRNSSRSLGVYRELWCKVGEELTKAFESKEKSGLMEIRVQWREC
jgi:hypothetical protein